MAFVSGGAVHVPRGHLERDRRGDPFQDDFGNCGCIPVKKHNPRLRGAALLKERIRQFSIWYFETEEQRENEHVNLRFERKKKKLELSQLTSMRLVVYLFVMDVLAWITGLMFTFCSTMLTFGKNTPFYGKTEYKIGGSITLAFSAVLLCVCIALQHKVKKSNDMAKPLRPFYIMKRGGDRKRNKNNLQFSKLTYARIARGLFVIDALAWIAGAIFTLCSTMLTFGKNTPFYGKIEYKIGGPLTLVFSAVLLFVWIELSHRIGMSNNRTKQLDMVKKKQRLIKKEESVETDDSGNVADIEMAKGPKKEMFWKRKIDNEENEDLEIVKYCPDTQTPENLEWESSKYKREVNDSARVEDRKLSQQGKEKRLAWTKSKWMGMRNEGTQDSWGSEDAFVSEFPSEISVCGDEARFYDGFVEGKERDFMSPFRNISTDDEEQTGAEMHSKFSRNFSTKSKVSDVSNFSNFSETALLVKK